MSRVKRFLLIAVAVVVLVLTAWTLFTLSWSYSEGERAGYVQKLSERGWICKTWEGELAMANLPGAMPEVFHFTVRDDAVAEKINSQLGSRVAVSYEQHLGLPSCFGETSYWVQSVRKVDP